MKLVDLCRTWLFLPGADKDVLMAAPGRGADVLIQDLEDFTPPELRPAARALSSDIYRAWKEAGCVAGVRVNRLQEDGQKDLAAVMGAAPDIVLLPMVDEPAEMVALEDAVALHAKVRFVPQFSHSLAGFHRQRCFDARTGTDNRAGLHQSARGLDKRYQLDGADRNAMAGFVWLRILCSGPISDLQHFSMCCDAAPNLCKPQRKTKAG